MSYVQTITPNPNVACTPGWCLKYVQDAFGLSAVYGTAIASWNASPTQHADQDFPTDCWVPVWFSLRDEPAGHVALRAPDGSIYSSSDPKTNVPHHHPSLAALIQYYAKANPLTYLGWTEDVEGTYVIQGEDVKFQNREEGKRLYVLAQHRNYEKVSDDEADGLIGREFLSIYSDWVASDEWNYANDVLLRAYPALQSSVATEQKQVTDLQVQLKDEQTKSVGLVQNVSDLTTQLQAANAKIADLSKKIATASATADKPQPTQPTGTVAPTTSTKPPTPQAPTFGAWLVSLLSAIKGKK